MRSSRRHRLAAAAVVVCCVLLGGTDPGTALPGIPAPPIGYVLLWQGGPPGSWATPVLRGAADAQDFQRLAAILRSAAVIPGVSWNQSRDGLSVFNPGPVMSSGYTVAWRGGPQLNVTNTVDACSGNTCGPAPTYAQVDGVVVHAPGLIPLLESLAHRTRQVDSLVATPWTQAPGGPLTIAGQGWIGPTVRISLSWGVGVGPDGVGFDFPIAGVPQGGTESRVLAGATVEAGTFRWTGTLPGDLAPGTYGLSADDGARSVAWLNLQVT